MTDTVTIRPAVPADEEALGRLGAALVRQHHGFDAKRFIPPGRNAEEHYGRFLVGEIGGRDTVVLAAEQGGAVIGYCSAGLEGKDWLALRGPAGAIYDIIIDPNARGHGSGRRLLDAMLAALAERGAPQVVLSTATQNEIAQRLFAEAGFRPTMIEMTRELD
jgi:ribosomal protein S18 acetylase RimI-like enzyme